MSKLKSIFWLNQQFIKHFLRVSPVFVENNLSSLKFEIVKQYKTFPTQLYEINSLRFLSKKVQTNLIREDYQSGSDSDSDDDDYKSRHKERGESEFWRRKMRTLHTILDLNKDGVISFDDFKLLTERFISLGHLSQQHRLEFQAIIQQLWEIQHGAIDPYNLMTTEQFLEDMHHVLNDKELRKKAHKFLPYLFKAVDKDHSGEISVEEFKLFFKCLGLTEQDAIISFVTIDSNHDGKLSLKEFIKLGREFLLTEDENKPSRLLWGPLVVDSCA